MSPLTVSRAITDLAREGILVTRPGAGTFVAQPQGRPHADQALFSWQTVTLGERPLNTEGMSPLADPPHADGVVSLASGYLHSSLMPLAALRSALARTARLPDSWERPPAFGLHSLRSWFAQDTGAGADAQDVLITSGSQGALSIALRALVPPGAPLLVESPTYPGALAAARAAGIRPVPVPLDAEGVIPEHLAEAFARTGARAFFCQPAFHNPAGTTLASGRRAAVLEIAAAAGAFIIEDDVARVLSHYYRRPAPLLRDDQDGRVVYLTSLTKVTSPSLRVGAMIARGPVADRLRALSVVDQLFVSRPLQETALDLVSRAAWDRHLKELSRCLRRRADTLASAAARHLPAVDIRLPEGGMHLWASLPKDLDDTEIAQATRQHGVIVMPGRPFFPAEAQGPHLRLTFSGAPTEAELELGVTRLAQAAPELTG